MNFGHPGANSFRSYLVLTLLAGMGVLLALWPIVAYDNDLFYHLAGGRYIFENLRLPDGPYFSYLASAGTWVDYYWLHQVFLYTFFKLGGYEALVLVRAALFILTVWFVYRYLSGQARQGGNGATLLVLSLTILYAMAILPRDLLLRPHVFSYMGIAVFMLIINQRPQLGWLLPAIGVVWVNLHGVEYPVMLLICGAYLCEYFIAKLLRRPVPNELRQLRWPLIATMYTVLATPAGTGLLLKPFAAPLFHELVINELRATKLSDLVVFSLYPVSNAVGSLANLLMVILGVSATVLCVMRRIRLSRLILIAGGLLLLPQSRRFTYEFVLLLLPLIGDALFLLSQKTRDISWRAAVSTGLAMVCGTIFVVVGYLGYRPHFPLSHGQLPVGVCDFLEKEGPGGRILNEPNSGGYLVWRLHPKYSLFMDMETMLFSSFDFFQSSNFAHDKTVLGKMLERYAPDFIMIAKDDQGFAETMAGFPRLVPVFLDDYAVLYADSDKHPGLVGKYRMEALPIAGMASADYKAMNSETRAKALVEAQRLLAVYPEGLVANAVVTKILMAEGQLEKAAVHAEMMVSRHPEHFMGYALGAQVAFEQNDFKRAVKLNLKALDRANPVEGVSIKRNLYAAYVRLEEYSKGYEALKDVANPLVWNTPAKDLYDLGIVAALSGKGREGLLLLDMALTKAPAEDEELIKEIEKYRTKLNSAIGR